jgi:hypothetical protein
MDVNKIFGFFSEESNNDSLDDYVKDKYKDHPLYWISMACKLYINHKVFNKQILNLFIKNLDQQQLLLIRLLRTEQLFILILIHQLLLNFTHQQI